MLRTHLNIRDRYIKVLRTHFAQLEGASYSFELHTNVDAVKFGRSILNLTDTTSNVSFELLIEDEEAD